MAFERRVEIKTCYFKERLKECSQEITKGDTLL